MKEVTYEEMAEESLISYRKQPKWKGKIFMQDENTSYKDGFLAGLEAKVDLSIDCEKAQKNGDLCLGYGGDEDEPCERCKNCIKCECGYYQLGQTEKDDQLTKAKKNS